MPISLRSRPHRGHRRFTMALNAETVPATVDAMHLVQILLPCMDNQGQPFGQEEFERVKEELAGRFDGVTAFLQAPADGLWRMGAEGVRNTPGI